MITFYSCLQEYYKRSGAVQFSKKQIKRMSGYCKFVYDSSKNPRITYVESKEGDEVFTVRSYPDTFKRVITDTIEKAHRYHKSLKEIISPEKSVIETISPIVNNIIAANEASKEVYKNRTPRKRIPIIKPAYSAKPKTESEK